MAEGRGGVMGKRAKACDWRVGQVAKRRAGFVFSGEADMPLRPIALSPSRLSPTRRDAHTTRRHTNTPLALTR